MKILKNNFLVILMLIVIPTLLASAFTTNEITAPPATFTTSSTTSVNVSGGINASAFPNLNAGDHVNVDIQTKNSSTGAWSILASDTVNITLSNASDFWNKTVTLVEGYNWVRLNFTNVSRDFQGNFQGSLTSERIINVDTEKYKLQVGGFGKINFTLDTGDIEIAGNLTIAGPSQGITLHNQSNDPFCIQMVTTTLTATAGAC